MTEACKTVVDYLLTIGKPGYIDFIFNTSYCNKITDTYLYEKRKGG